MNVNPRFAVVLTIVVVLAVSLAGPIAGAIAVLAWAQWSRAA
jgi:hypothetical protein